MRVAFVYPEMEILGIEYLSAVLKANSHETKLFFDPQLFMDTVSRKRFLANIFDYSDKIVKDILNYNPYIVAFSVMSTNYQWACKLSEKIKAVIDVKIVFGGMHPTSVPEQVIKNEFVDFVVVGEGEFAFLELVESGFERESLSNIRNLVYKNNGNYVSNNIRHSVEDLALIPFPDKDLFYDVLPYLQQRYTIISGRGCPNRCTFCCNSFVDKLYSGKFLRRRTVKNVISELFWALNKYEIKYIFFDDPTFTYDKRWLDEFTQSYSDDIGLPSFCWVYPNDIDERSIAMLKKMNCKAVEMGVQTLDINIRREVFHRYYTNETVKKAINMFRENKIFCIVDNMKGFYQDKESEIIDFVQFYNENRPDKIYLFEFRPFPKIEILERDYYKDKAITDILPFTVVTSLTDRRVKQLEMLLILIYLVPKHVVRYILKKRIYRLFIPLSSFGMFEVVPYFINLLKNKNSRLWYPTRDMRRRYVYCFLLNSNYFIKRLFELLFRKRYNILFKNKIQHANAR